MATTGFDVLAAADAFGRAVSTYGPGAIEDARRLPPELADEAVRLGLMRLFVPRELDGPEVEPASALAAMESIAQIDASAGWVVMIAGTTSVMGGHYPIEVAREFFGPASAVCGVAAPLGRAHREADGLRLTGRWPFGSGSQVATALVGGCTVMDGDEPVPRDDGSPDTRLAIFPAGQATILDTWHVSGLRGTGSADFSVDSVFIPAGHTTEIGRTRPWCDRPLYRLPFWGLLALGIGAVALGIGRAAIDELTRLAGGKVPIGSRRALSERHAVQADVSIAEARLRSARALFYESLASVWDRISLGQRMSFDDRALLRLAATNAAWSSVAVVDSMYTAGGGTSNYESSPLQRHFRDIHALTQHVMVQQSTWEMTGRIFLGLPPNTPML